METEEEDKLACTTIRTTSLRLEITIHILNIFTNIQLDSSSDSDVLGMTDEEEEDEEMGEEEKEDHENEEEEEADEPSDNSSRPTMAEDRKLELVEANGHIQLVEANGHVEMVEQNREANATLENQKQGEGKQVG